MFNRLPELLINGASLLLLGKELMDNDATNNQWKNLYEAKTNECIGLTEEVRLAREDVVSQHNNFMIIMNQIQSLEKAKTKILKSYLILTEQLLELGIEIDDEGNVCLESSQSDEEGEVLAETEG